MENHVTDRELSERLKEAGVPQNSEFYWRQSDVSDGYLSYVSSEEEAPKDCIASAYLVSELGVWLPKSIFPKPGKEVWLIIRPYEVWHLWYGHDGLCVPGSEFHDTNEAQARGLCLEWLIDSGHVRTEELR